MESESNNASETNKHLLNDIDRKKLIFVTGKGGVGKTTVVCNLVYRFLKSGQKTLHLTIDQPEEALNTRVNPLFASFKEHYSFINLSGKECFREYISTRASLKFMADNLFGSSLYRAFVNAAPGLKELMVLGKILNQTENTSWEKIIVDLPSSGHALSYLRVPFITVKTFASGLVGKESARIVSLMQDERKTALLPVAIPEEMSVTEVLELADSSAGELKISVPFVLLNKHPGEIISKIGLERLIKEENLVKYTELLSFAGDVQMARAKKANHELAKLEQQGACKVIPVKISMTRRESITLLPELSS